MPQAEVTMDVRKVNERLLTYGPTKHYRNIFQITRLDDAITIYESEEGALQAVNAL
jgi:anti-sigma B factor antagonist